MNVYPVAASQVRFTMALLAMVAAIGAYDGLAVVSKEWIWDERWRRRVRRAALALPLAAYAVALASAVRTYVQLPPLGLAGAAGIRMDAEEGANYRWVVDRVNRSCDSFVSFPAMHSFYLWTGKPAPVLRDVDGWQPYRSRERQAVERRMLEGPRSCVVYIDRLVPFWLPHREAESTLLGEIRERFVEREAREGFPILRRK